MKIQKEHAFVIIVGLFLLSYVLESVVPPLRIRLSTPYSYLSPAIYGKYPFTAVIVILKSIALFLTPPFLFSFIKEKYFAKAGSVFLLGSLIELYSLQQLISGPNMISLEWAVSLSISGFILILTTILYILQGTFSFAKTKLSVPKISFEDIDAEE